jgi:hypothetical protein
MLKGPDYGEGLQTTLEPMDLWKAPFKEGST